MIRSKVAFRIIDTAEVPRLRQWPKRTLIVIAGTILGFVFGLVFYVPLLPWISGLVGPVPWLMLAALQASFDYGAAVRAMSGDPPLGELMAMNYRAARLNKRQRAMLDFAMKVALHSAEIGDADYAALRGHGFSDEDAWDIGAIAAFFALSNRMANLTGMRANDEFYLMGRLPREKPGAG